MSIALCVISKSMKNWAHTFSLPLQTNVLFVCLAVCVSGYANVSFMSTRSVIFCWFIFLPLFPASSPKWAKLHVLLLKQKAKQRFCTWFYPLNRCSHLPLFIFSRLAFSSVCFCAIRLHYSTLLHSPPLFLLLRTRVCFLSRSPPFQTVSLAFLPFPFAFQLIQGDVLQRAVTLFHETNRDIDILEHRLQQITFAHATAQFARLRTRTTESNNCALTPRGRSCLAIDCMMSFPSYMFFLDMQGTVLDANDFAANGLG